MVGITFFAARMLSPNNPNPEKLTSYECGEDPTGGAWMPFNTRFYVIALIFLLFDVEMIFVIPWATVFGNKDIISFDGRWGWLSLAEMFIFLGILILGLAYVWRKGDLNWIKPSPVIPTVDSRIPASLYDEINIQQSKFAVKEFTLERTIEPAASAATDTSTTTTAPSIRKPMFKPTFKKPGNES